tara:strand:- start:286 stop:459 length:174 start_codon:yes stop_codon:yes gene_type:complete
MIQKTNIQGVIALIIIAVGLYILGWTDPENDVKIAVVGLMGSVIGYYFGNSKKNTNE